jgi:hypothetical protein
LVRRGPQDLAINNLALTPFITKLVRTLDSISLNNNNECVTYFNFITNPQIASSEKIKFRRQAENKILRKFYQVMRGATSELEDL